jgi:hypothetical protein
MGLILVWVHCMNNQALHANNNCNNYENSLKTDDIFTIDCS